MAHFKAGGAGGTDETSTNKDTHQMPVISMGTLIDVPASFPRGRGKGLSQEPHPRFFSQFDDSPFLVIRIAFLSFRSISELSAWMRVGNLWIWLYSTLDVILHGFPMDTSLRIPLDPYFLWFCMSGIQFPTDPMMDLFLV